jgi:dihydroneopterin aldolase
MKGKIGFDDLEVICIIGVNPEERVLPQKLYFDLRVEMDLSASVHSDEMKDALDYRRLAAICTDIAKEGAYQLLEALAGNILLTLMGEFTVLSAWIRIKKPNAIPSAKCSVIEMELTQ